MGSQDSSRDAWDSVCERVRYHRAQLKTAETVASRVDSYRELMMARHDTWAYYASCMLEKKVHDTKVSKFVDSLRKNEIRPIKYSDPPNEIKNKTPDILMYRPEIDAILLGDVTVTEVPTQALRLKKVKYQPIYKFLAQKARVIECYLPISEDLSNIEVVLKDLIDSRLFKDDVDIRLKCISMHKDINHTMQLCINLMQPGMRNDFWQLMANKNLTHEGLDYSQYTDGLDEMPTYEPKYELSYYIEQVKKITDENYKTMFDTDYEPARKAFINLEDEIKKQPDDTFLPSPKSPLQICDNSKTLEEKTSHALVLDYVLDLQQALSVGRDDKELDAISYALNLLPSVSQLNVMADFKDIDRSLKVYGPWQYTQTQSYDSALMRWHKEKLKLGRKRRNEKKAPKRVHPDRYSEIMMEMEEYMSYLGSPSDKPNIMRNSEWEAKTQAEMKNSEYIKTVFDYVSSTNGVQLATAMNQTYQRIYHLSAKKSSKTNLVVPPNGAFLMVIPKEHAPLTQANVDIPFVTITRVPVEEKYRPLSYHAMFATDAYRYYISKLARINADKMDTWDQSHYKIIMTATYLGSKMKLDIVKMQRLVGIITMYSLDTHQKTSELLDLFKYVVYMPLSSLSMLSKLVEDKFNIMLKTHLDVWTLKETEKFMLKLSSYRDMPKKPRLKVINGRILDQSYGIKFKLPSFGVMGYEHTKVEDYIDETSTYFTLRGKKFGGNQFMQRSITAVVDYDIQYEEEILKHGDWVTSGKGNGDYPFDADFAFSADMVHYATRDKEQSNTYNHRNARVSLQKQDLLSPMHYVCSLRGSLKQEDDMKHDTDYHSTALHEALKHYKKVDYCEEKCTVMHIGVNAIKTQQSRQIESAKEQRGPGRPINTPDLATKAMYALIEFPERTITNTSPHNVMAQGRNKLLYLEKTYKNACEVLVERDIPFMAQVTEDQTKWSEKDNTEKFRVMVQSSVVHKKEIRQIQYNALAKFKNRIHIEKNMPDVFNEVTGEEKYYKRLRKVKGVTKCREVVLNIGWPQGMLNYISTNLHEIAFSFSIKCYNMAYPDEEVYLFPLVHSDDSWYTIGYRNPETYQKFCTFMMYFKRFFCLKVNKKKWWSSPIGGEMVSNMNFNGETIKPLSKTIANCTQNLLYQTYPIDAQSRVSALQQMVREGADMPVLIMCHTVLRHQLYSNYNMRNRNPDIDYSLLPIEMGGYPDCSAFELAVTGLKGHYFRIWKSIRDNPHKDESIMVLKLAAISQDYRLNKRIEKNPTAEFDQEAYFNISTPERPDIFMALKHKLPKIKKIAETIKAIDELTNVDDGLGMLITRAFTLDQALGHLKGQTNSQIYALASEHYSSKKKRLAVSQAIQATGKTVVLHGYPPMTIDEMLLTVKATKTRCLSSDYLQLAFYDEGEITDLTFRTVYQSDISDSAVPKTRRMNRMPTYRNVFQTTTKFQLVLMAIYDEEVGTDYVVRMYPSEDKTYLEEDKTFVKRRFSIYFTSYELTRSLSLINQLYQGQIKQRLFNQPKLRTDNIMSFITDLYGHTLSSSTNYYVTITDVTVCDSVTERLIDSLYTAEQLNSIYRTFTPTHVKVKVDDKIQTLKKEVFIKDVDTSNLDLRHLEKHAVLMFKYFNTDHHIRSIDDGSHYRQYWPQPQVMKGQYSGSYKAMATMGGITVQIEGNTNTITRIITNKLDIRKILELLHVFIKQNFKSFSYISPGSWNQSAIFKSGHHKGSYLVYRGLDNTVVEGRHPGNKTPCIAYYVNRHLTYNGLMISKDRITYSIDEYMRKVLYYGTKASAIIIGSHMPLPMPQSILLKSDTYEGFLVSELFERRVITNMTLMRLDNIQYSDIEVLIGMKQNDNVLVDVINSIFHPDACGVYQIQGTEYEFISIEATAPSEIPNEDFTMSDPQSMAYDYIEKEEYFHMQNGLYKISGMLEKLCDIIGRDMTPQDIVDFTWRLLSSEFKPLQAYKDMCHDDWDDAAETTEMVHDYNLPIPVFATILKNRLYLPSTYERAFQSIRTGLVAGSDNKQIVFHDKNNQFINTLYDDMMTTICGIMEGMNVEEYKLNDGRILSIIENRLSRL